MSQASFQLLYPASDQHSQLTRLILTRWHVLAACVLNRYPIADFVLTHRLAVLFAVVTLFLNNIQLSVVNSQQLNVVIL